VLKRYPVITEIQERLDFELLTILILVILDISDCTGFNCRSQSMGVSVGPGRGSAGIGGGVLFENYQYRSIDVQPAFERF
jgi:hypothetical protein